MAASTTKIEAIGVLCDEEVRTRSKKHRHERHERYEYVNIPLTNHVFTEGEISPISEALGLPLRVIFNRPSIKRKGDRNPLSWDQKPSWKDPLVGPEYFENAIAAALMVDIETGVTPAKWTNNVGCILVARNDQKPLYPDDFEKLLNVINKQRGIWAEQRATPESK